MNRSNSKDRGTKASDAGKQKMPATKEYFRVSELVDRWHLSDRTVRRILKQQHDLLTIPSSSPKCKKKTHLVPVYVVARIENEMRSQAGR